MKTFVVDISFEVESDEPKEKLLEKVIKDHPTLQEVNIQEGKRYGHHLFPRLKAVEKSLNGY